MLDLVIPAEGRIVPDYIGANARIVLVGEAPGRREDEMGQPFVGPSEAMLRSWWRAATPQLMRSDFYITNVCPVRPPGNEIAAMGREYLRACAEKLRNKLREIKANVIVPTGNTALWALFDEHRSITDWRGSILEWEGHKVIPTIHPAAVLRQPALGDFCVADWKRIASESLFPEIYVPGRTHIIDPTEEDLRWFISGLKALEEREKYAQSATCPASDIPPAVMAVDVENPRDTPRKLTCVGFAYDPLVSLTIPLEETGTSLPLRRRWEAVKELCGLSIPKVLQNGLTDQIKLAANGVELRQYDWDLIEMAHCLNPNDGGDTMSDDEVDLGGPQIRISMKSLAVLASLYTRQPYWKHLSESPDWEVRQRYNGLDACVTREVFDPLWRKMKEKGLL